MSPHCFCWGFVFIFHFSSYKRQACLLPIFGGDGTRLGITAYYDTGSTSLTIFDTDLEYLGDVRNYTGCCEDAHVFVADGGMERIHSLWVQISFVVPETLLPWGPWILEQAIIRKAGNGVVRLSGSGMRQELYFGISPGNSHVAVATTKGGINLCVG